MRDELVTPHGRCVILEPAEPPALIGGELAIAAGLGEVRRRELACGRGALRDALGAAVAILADDRGAPILPAGWLGSVSHKRGRAAALVAPDRGDGARIGVDLELAAPPRQPIERRILTPREAHVTGREVALRFAIKEAIYKAIDPFVRRYVAFTEVELEVGGGGACRVHTAIPLAIDAWWCERDGYWLATARAYKAGTAGPGR
ncbi:MAG TPA: 4'-phosphopantetheinyl transferase superfamily protein [Kofleriaceae bacterium]|nr:4'-phosphopantetheinyl transferase superfamily protein [Kofleriaceae bacterium]